MNMGLSPSHASTVPCVLNLETGAISPQFHVIFDDWFATVPASDAEEPDLNSPVWADLFGDSNWEYFGGDDNEGDTVIEVDYPASNNEDRSDAIVNQFDTATHLPEQQTEIQQNSNPALLSQATELFKSPALVQPVEQNVDSILVSL